MTNRSRCIFISMAIVITLMFTLCSWEQLEAAEEPLTIRVAVENTPDHPQTIGMQIMKEYIEAKSGGKIKVNIYANAQMGSEMQTLEQVQNGSLEMASASIAPVATFQEKFSVLDIPFLFNNAYEAWATLDSPVGTNLLATLDETGLKGLAFMENGFRNVTNSVRPIRSIKDFKGLKIRTMESPMHIASFTALGANPTPIPYTELYMAMSQKIVDGQENPLPNIWDVKMDEVQKYCSLTKHIYDTLILTANLKWYNSLPLEYRAIINVGAVLGQNYSRFINAGRNDVIVSGLRAKGMEVNELTPEALEAIKAVAQPAVVQLVEKRIDGAFVNEFLAGIKRVRTETVRGVK